MKPLAITMGCPVGIGPEIILRHFLQHGQATADCIVIGDIHLLRQQAQHFGFELQLNCWRPGDSCKPGVLSVYSVTDLGMDSLNWGAPTIATGKAMAGYITEAVSLVQAEASSAIVTCPITKTALQRAGFNYPGHTEMLATLCHADRFTMMMAGPTLKVTLVTIHSALADVASSLNKERILERIELTWESLRGDFAIDHPRIAVAGFNPHAGEEGVFGREEIDIIAPAVAAARDRGMDITGPLPPDTVFTQAAAGRYDAVVCMYHDQGLIPFKLLHFSDGVNMTIGLPLVRTSVDHGTAYDIAGKGKADPTSLGAAINLARTVAANRKQHGEQNS